MSLWYPSVDAVILLYEMEVANNISNRKNRTSALRPKRGCGFSYILSLIFFSKKCVKHLAVRDFCVNTHTESRAEFIIIFRHINALAKRFSSFSSLLPCRSISSPRLFFRRERCEVYHIRQQYAPYDTVPRILPMYVFSCFGIFYKHDIA